MHRFRFLHRCSIRLAVFAYAIALAACATPGVRGQETPIDLARFMGTWHVIAHVPYAAERGHVSARDEYTLRPGGGVDVHYVYRNGFHSPLRVVEATASVQPDSGNRIWKLRFFHVIPARQRILEIAPDGAWALIDSPGRELAWVFARKPTMDDATYQDLLRRLRGYGINSDKLWRVPQLPSQVGRLGFDRPREE
ncbi:lipocalin family protein [Dyella sp.]|uniref:lipocalin family protein n=1 Tax=Dyella sp. TaxID=1869338 RepID=UPI002D76996D|nr:lipocalin family protein [Dyella sp.]HET6430892.1 lipocalin family protein [Dyella sp.]